MATDVINCYELRTEDWGHGTSHECYIQDEVEAHMYKAKYHCSISPKIIVIHETCDDAVAAKTKAIKERALSKLSEEERRALGF